MEEMAKLKAEKKQKKAQKRQKDVEMRYVGAALLFNLVFSTGRALLEAVGVPR